MHDDTYYFNIIRHNIKRIRKTKNITKEELAQRIGVTTKYIEILENEDMPSDFTVAIVGKIADALQVDISELFKEPEKK